MHCLSRGFLGQARLAKLPYAMFMHLSPKERFGYVALGAILLLGGGFIAAQKLRRPATINLHETEQPPVTFDHGPSRATESLPTRTSETSGSQIIVHVAGAVNRPGLVALPPGSRVYDAVREAGGPTEDANVDGVNLAAKAIDGSQVYFPRRGLSGGPSLGTAPPTSRSSRVKQPSGVIDINSADTSQLQTLPGIGTSMAQRIVDFRTEHGTFRSVEDLLAVQGFGKSRLEKIRQWLTAE